MKATEARQLAKEANTLQDLTEVYAAIKRAANLGDYEVCVYLYLTDKQQAELTGKGYKISIAEDKIQAVCVTISWKL